MRFFKSIIWLFFFAGSVKAQIVYTYAGNGIAGFSGDGGPATLAQVNSPDFITIDAGGNIYFGDNTNTRIRKVTPSGIITTIAGTGVAGFSGDGGPATSAQIKGPKGIAIDAVGNIYFVDRANLRIRKINTTGIISTIAGTGASSYTGDGGPATSATLGWPWDIKIDASGNIIFSDFGNHCIRKIDAAGIITTIVGNGNQGNSGDGGPATSALLNFPTGITFDGVGNLIIANGHSSANIRKVNTSGIINSICGTGVAGYSGDGGPATSAQTYLPDGITLDASGNIYFCDGYNYRIRKINTSGIISTIAGIGTTGYSGDGGLATLAQMEYPTGIAIDASGNIYFADPYNNRVRVICPSNCFAGIDPITEKGSLLFYPNPTSNNLFFESDENNLRNSKIEITNYLGQTVLRSEFKNQIDVSELASGFYTLLLKDNSGSVITKKFVKE